MKNRTFYFLAGIIIIIIGIFFSLHYQPDLIPDNEIIDLEEKNLLPEDQLKNVQLVFYNSDASVSWHLDSELINNYTQSQILELFPVNIAAVNEEGQLLYNMDASDTLYNLNSGIIELTGPIKIKKDQIIFQTAKINWQDGKDILSATGGIFIESPAFLIKGESLESDLTLNNVVITGKEGEQAYFTWKDGSDQDQDL